MTVRLHEHQQKAVDKLSNGKILYGGTGVGKSITAMAYFFTKVCGGTLDDWTSPTTPMDIYVITTAKKRDDGDWLKEAKAFGISTDSDVSFSNIQLTVDSWNNINKYKDTRNAFFIFDEQRLVGSGAWTKAFIEIAKHNQWILLSATPGDTWLDYIPVFVANGFYKNRTEFKRRHVVYNTFSKFPKVDRYIETGTLVKHRNAVLVHMPYERHTVRHVKDVKVEYDHDKFEKVSEKRWHVYEERPIRDVAELFAVMRKVVNSDSSRLEAVRTLMAEHPKLIVFYNFDYELEQLRTLISPAQMTPTSKLWDGKLDDESKKRWGSTTPTTTRSEESFEASKDTHGLGPAFDCQEGRKESCARDYPLPKVSLAAHSEETSSTRTAATLHLERSSSTGSDESTTKTGSGSKSSSLAVAEWNGHKHEPIPQTDRWVYLVQYAAGSEGWNCTATDAVCFYSLTYSYKHYHQAHGRIDRLNTKFKDLWYYNLVSDSFIDRAVQKSLKAKRSFNQASMGLKVA